MRTISSVDDLIAHFGGVTATGQVFGVTPQVVNRWRMRGHLPARSFLIHRNMLVQRGVDAPPALWAVRDPAEQHHSGAA